MWYLFIYFNIEYVFIGMVNIGRVLNEGMGCGDVLGVFGLFLNGGGMKVVEEVLCCMMIMMMMRRRESKMKGSKVK